MAGLGHDTERCSLINNVLAIVFRQRYKAPACEGRKQRMKKQVRQNYKSLDA